MSLKKNRPARAGTGGAVGELFERLEPRTMLSNGGLDMALFYPEGFATSETREVVTLQNTVFAPAEFRLIARYESGSPASEVIASGTLRPSERRDIVLSREGALGEARVRPFTPYALELRTDGDVGAALTRRDFGATAIEPFAARTAEVWSFPTLVRDAENARDFVTVFNPGDEPVRVRLDVFNAGGRVTSVERQIGPQRRAGFALNAIGSVPAGRVGAQLVASAPVVAASSHFDPAGGRAVMNLGAPAGEGEQTARVVSTGLGDFDEFGAGQTTLGILNTGTTGGRVGLTVQAGSGVDGQTREIRRELIVRPGARTEVSARALGLAPGEQILAARFDTALQQGVGGVGGAIVGPTLGATTGIGAGEGALPITVGGESLSAVSQDGFGPVVFSTDGVAAGTVLDGAGAAGAGTAADAASAGIAAGLGAGLATGLGAGLGTGFGTGAGLGSTAGTVLGGNNLSFTNPLASATLGTAALGTAALGTATGTPGAASALAAPGTALGGSGTLLGRSQTLLGGGLDAALGTGGLGTTLTSTATGALGASPFGADRTVGVSPFGAGGAFGAGSTLTSVGGVVSGL